MTLGNPTLYTSQEKISISLEGNTIHWLYWRSVTTVLITPEFLTSL